MYEYEISFRVSYNSDFSFLLKAEDREGGDANLEVSDIRRSSLSQLTREGDVDRVRSFLDFSGDESLKKINKLDESKVMTNLF